MLIPRPEPHSYIFLITGECLTFVENKYHMLCLECYKGHFMFPRDGASVSIWPFLDFPQMGESKKEIAYIAFRSITRKRFIFMKNKEQFTIPELDKDHFEY